MPPPNYLSAALSRTFVLCEALRQVDSPAVVQQIAQKQLALDVRVWFLDSPTFNPLFLSGMVSERTVLEAVVTHNDNTGTDMLLKLVGPDSVPKFIASAGLKHTQIPDSTRIFYGCLLGAKDYKTFAWDQVVTAQESDTPFVNSPLNNVETLASSADDLVSYYHGALQGKFFKNTETLKEFRRICPSPTPFRICRCRSRRAASLKVTVSTCRAFTPSLFQAVCSSPIDGCTSLSPSTGIRLTQRTPKQ